MQPVQFSVWGVLAMMPVDNGRPSAPLNADAAYRNYLETYRVTGIKPVPRARVHRLASDWAAIFGEAIDASTPRRARTGARS